MLLRISSYNAMDETYFNFWVTYIILLDSNIFLRNLYDDCKYAVKDSTDTVAD
jgi:hypothetical protein